MAKNTFEYGPRGTTKKPRQDASSGTKGVPTTKKKGGKSAPSKNAAKQY